MIEGIKLFTQYTHLWKTHELAAISKERMKALEKVEVSELRSSKSGMVMTPTRGVLGGKQYKPILPRPSIIKPSVKISFVRPAKEIKKVANFLLGTPNAHPKTVGEACFDSALKEATE